MKTRRYVGGKEKLNSSEEVSRKTKEYLKKHPNADYLTASNAVLHANPSLAKDYVGGTGTFDGEIDTRPSFAPAEPEKKSRYQLSLEASAELADIATGYTLQYNVDYENGFKLACKRNPELEKQYCLELIG